jgi:hypothetical protein
LAITVPDKHVFTLDGAHRIGVDFAGHCQGSVEKFLRIKRLIEAVYAGGAVGVRLDIGSGSVAIPSDPNRMWVFYSSAESLRIPDWIDVVHADDFRSCPNLREVIAGLQREIGGFRDCGQLQRVELSRSVEVIGRGAFSADKDGCHVFIAGKGAQKEEKCQAALSGIISYLTAKCGGNVHDRGVVEVTASSVFDIHYPQNTTDLGTEFSYFCSENQPGQWICMDFKTVRIEPPHYTVQSRCKFSHSGGRLKNLAVENSDDGASWTEIDRRENNSDLNREWAVKTLAVSRSGSFGRIRLRQTVPNHWGDNELALTAFELFETVAGLRDDFLKFCFPTAPMFPFTWGPFNGVISRLTAKCGGNVHDKGAVEITASSTEK